MATEKILPHTDDRFCAHGYAGGFCPFCPGGAEGRTLGDQRIRDAAPALLAALEDVERRWQAQEPLIFAMPAVRAAIAQARGEAAS